MNKNVLNRLSALGIIERIIEKKENIVEINNNSFNPGDFL